MKKIVILNDYSTCDHFYGGRTNFILEMYDGNQDVEFLEISYQRKKPNLNGEFVRKNVKYVSSHSIREIGRILSDYSFVYAHTLKTPIHKIKKTGFTLMLQQHFKWTYYKKKDLKAVDEMICYTSGDCEKFLKYVKSATQFYMGSNVNPSKPRVGGLPLYSGGTDVKSISTITNMINKNEKLILDIIKGGLVKMQKRFEAPNIIFRSSVNKSDVYLGASCFIQVSDKGYSLSAIEALSQGVPSFMLNNSVSYKSIVLNSFFLCDTIDEMAKKISEFKLTREVSNECIEKYKRDFYNANKRIYQYLLNK